MLPFLLEAAKIALPSDLQDKRNFILGAIGVRKDGAIVSAKNGAVITSTYDDYRIVGDAHAEARVIRKLGRQGTIYVARVLKKDGSLAMARPCGACRLRIRASQVTKVYYTIDDYHYGLYDANEAADRIYEVGNGQARIRNGNFKAATEFDLPGIA